MVVFMDTSFHSVRIKEGAFVKNVSSLISFCYVSRNIRKDPDLFPLGSNTHVVSQTVSCPDALHIHM